jgi:hypothetical protein
MSLPQSDSPIELSSHARRRRFGCTVVVLLGAALLLLLFNALLWTVQAAREANRKWRPTNTETGYQFPDLSDVVAMEVRGWIPQGSTYEEALDFTAPEESWGGIIAGLSPSAIEPLPPSSSAMGQLTIQTKEGDEVCVQLWSFEGWATGAFSAGPSFEMARYYRGGNTEQLQKALEEAHARYLQQQQESVE